jgi:N-acetylmuramidase
MAVCLSEPVEGTRVPSVVSPIQAVAFYSQSSELQQSSATAVPPLTVNPAWSASQRAIAAIFNRLGDLFRRLTSLVNVPIAAALAVWFVESSGLPLTPGRAILRFEVGKFLAAWGRANPAGFDAHFQCGGHNGKAGEPWQNHAFRLTDAQPFMPVHADSASEYAALQLAQQLSSAEVALRCTSIGGCQILLSNFAMLGYASAKDMFDAFQRSENAHVLGFFDFCTRQAGGLIGYLQQRDFASFALHYNGPGQVQLYAARLRSAAADAETVLAAR